MFNCADAFIIGLQKKKEFCNGFSVNELPKQNDIALQKKINYAIL
jgi:hypothetical protein